MDAENESVLSTPQVQNWPENPHTLVASAIKHFEKAKTQRSGFVTPQRGNGLYVLVTPSCVARAIRLADALLKALEAKGYKLGTKKGEDGGVCVEIDGQEVGVSIEEDIDHSGHTPTKFELARKKREFWFRIPKYDERPSGRISFIIDNTNGGWRRWREGSRWKQEQRIDKVVLGIERAAAALKAARLESERRHREWEEESKRREEATRLQAEERSRVQAVGEIVYRWRLARDVRSLMAELGAVSKGEGDAGQKQDLSEFVTWAIAYADRIDPVARNRVRLATGSLPPLPEIPMIGKG
jgi:hypothetical protein